jgi:hypothetical protein
MLNSVVTLSENEVSELKIIVMDRDDKGAFAFLKEKILPQILKKEKSRLDVDWKIHL